VHGAGGSVSPDGAGRAGQDADPEHEECRAEGIAAASSAGCGGASRARAPVEGVGGRRVMRRSGGWLRASVVVVCGLAVGGGGWWGVEVAAGGSPPAGPDTAGKHVVEMREFKFVPARVEAAVGDTIVWVNKDAVPHTATDSAAAWDSGS